MQRISVLIAGASGQGINSCGDILARALKQSGYFVHTYREYPSIIKGGSATMQVDIAGESVSSSGRPVQLVLALNRDEVMRHLDRLEEGGVLLHFTPTLKLTEAAEKQIADKQLRVICLPALAYLSEHKLDILYVNTYMLGALWKGLGQTADIPSAYLAKKFGKKPEAAEKNVACFMAGYTAVENEVLPLRNIPPSEAPKTAPLMDGTRSIVLGIIGSGTRAHFAYPMSPSSGIIAHLGRLAPKTGMLVKQAEDEVTAINMTVGSNLMGTRATTATSGGGYDLMTEGISLASITETPVVVVLCQRPGPGTGLPTWTSQADLNLAVFAGHGDNPKCIIALSHPRSSVRLMAEAWNIAETYQIPVIVLADKWMLEDHVVVPDLEPAPALTRGKLQTEGTITPGTRYDPTPLDGISTRYLPGMEAPTYDANSDEHDGDGNVREDAEMALLQADKRMRKEEALQRSLPEPKLYGKENGKTLVVGWGSTKLVMEDLLGDPPEVSYLHYEYVWPITTERLAALAKGFDNVILLEGNKTGQFGQLLAMHGFTGFTKKILRYDGRPFFTDELLAKLMAL